MNIFRKQILGNNEETDARISELENKLAHYEQEFSTLLLQVQSLLEKVDEKEKEIEEKSEQIDGLNADLEQKQEEITATQEVIKEVVDNTLTVEKLASIKALEILSNAGTEVVETLDAPVEVDLLKQMKSLHGKELQAFYKANKQELFKKLKSQ